MALIYNRLQELEDEHYNLLLEADPSKELVSHYFKRSLTFEVLKDGVLVGIVVLIETRPETLEIVNISVSSDHQNQGIGQEILQFAINYGKENQFIVLEIGTGSTSFSQLYLYQKMGFRITGIDKDFFVHHYDEEIIENGLILKDMVRLQLLLN